MEENHRRWLLEADELLVSDLVCCDSDRRQLHYVNAMSKSRRYRLLVEADLGRGEPVDAVVRLVS